MNGVALVDDRQRRIRSRNRALLLLLLGVVALFYLIALVRLGVWS